MSALNALITAIHDNPLDTVAFVLFITCWMGYELILQKIGKRLGVIVKDLSVIRTNWMREMVIRSFKMYDSNLMGHAVNSATHFSSANLILIAALGGVLFGGHIPINSVRQLGFEATSTQLFQIKIALVVVCLVRGLLNFIWSLRQMNYCAAAMGSLPENMDAVSADKFSAAMSNIIEPAMSNFSRGVRGYYFALASAAWLFGPWYLIIASLGATALLGWRQSRSQAAKGLRQLRELLEEHPYPTPTRPIQTADAQKFGQNAAPQNDLG